MIVKLVKTENRSKFLPLAYPFVLMGLVLASTVIKKGNDILWINGQHTSLLDTFFSAITNLGDGAVFIPIVFLAVLIRYRYAAAVLTTLLGNAILVSLCKQVLFATMERPRLLLGDAAIHFVVGIDVHRLHSFPSGHTVTAFSAAVLIALLTRNGVSAMIVLLLALLVGYSRIYLAQHFIIDVAAGALIGSITALIAWQIFESKGLPRWLHGRLVLT